MMIQNKKGRIPLQGCTPEVVSLVMNFKDSLASQKYALMLTEVNTDAHH